MSLSQETVPTCFKTATFVTVPKKSALSILKTDTVTLPIWWSALRNWFFSTSKMTSQPAWIPTNLHSEQTNPQRMSSPSALRAYYTLQLDIGLPHKHTTDSSDWQSHLVHSSAQHWSRSGLCAQLSLVQAVHPLQFPTLERTLLCLQTTPPSLAGFQTTMRIHTGRKWTILQSGVQRTI